MNLPEAWISDEFLYLNNLSVTECIVMPVQNIYSLVSPIFKNLPTLAIPRKLVESAVNWIRPNGSLLDEFLMS